MAVNTTDQDVQREPPTSAADARPQCPPERLELRDIERLRRATALARALYPGPVGELIYKELVSWRDFGYRFGGTLVARIVDHLIEKAKRDGA